MRVGKDSKSDSSLLIQRVFMHKQSVKSLCNFQQRTLQQQLLGRLMRWWALLLLELCRSSTPSFPIEYHYTSTKKGCISSCVLVVVCCCNDMQYPFNDNNVILSSHPQSRIIILPLSPFLNLKTVAASIEKCIQTATS